MAPEKVGLSAKELLNETFAELTQRLGGKKIGLPSKAMAEIANDSDDHRTRIGYTGYESAVVFELGGKQWAIALGEACGSYPAKPYNCDIAAIRLSTAGKSDEQVAEEIRDALESNCYFCNSLIFAMADGSLAADQNGSWAPKVVEILTPKIQDFVAKGMEIQAGLLLMDMRPVVRVAVLYKKELVGFLSDTLQTVLEA